MSYRTRPMLLALVAAVVLLIALSKETWIAIPIIAGIGVLMLSRSHHLGRGPTLAALGVIASLSLAAFGVVLALLASLARTLGGLVLASGLTSIAIGTIGLVASVLYLRRATRPAPPDTPAGLPDPASSAN